jgi:hypothetical protein
MNLASLEHRARTDFTEMPLLELTMPQASRLWAAGVDDCLAVVDTLVTAGFLMWTTRRTIVRSGREIPVPLSIDNDVRRTPDHDKSVGE